MSKMCEEYGAKQAGFGAAAERSERWCRSCGKAHGAVSLNKHKICGEECGAKRALSGIKFRHNSTF